jgi:hypothetical protein
MVAALLRVIHGGVQDARLLPEKGRPNPKFFVKAFVRAGRFTTQWVRLDFDTRPVFGNASTITLPRKGQLLSRLYLVTTMPDISTQQTAAKDWCTANGKTFVGPTFGWTNSVGHAVLNEASIEIGGTRVEQMDGRLLEVLDDYYTPLEKVSLMDKLLPRNSSSFTPGEFGSESVTRAVTPLPFWFCRGDPGAFLPIDAIQADLVRLTVRFNPLATVYTSTAQQRLSMERAPVGGDAYFPLAQSPFYYLDPSGELVEGLTGNPSVSLRVSKVPGIQLPAVGEIVLGAETYIMAEYIYLDRPEANRFRLADIQIPVVQHRPFEPVATNGASFVNCYLRVSNPTRNLFFYLQRREAAYYNAPFLATRDLSGSDTPIAPWWPNASPISTRTFKELLPGFVFRNSEPLNAINLVYEGKLYRYSTDAPVIFRSLIPSLELRKSPWVNRYFYVLPFALQSGRLPPSLPYGEANLDKITKINLQLGIAPYAGYSGPAYTPQYLVYIWAETYNILRVYGGRAGMMFST